MSLIDNWLRPSLTEACAMGASVNISTLLYFYLGQLDRPLSMRQGTPLEPIMTVTPRYKAGVQAEPEASQAWMTEKVTTMDTACQETNMQQSRAIHGIAQKMLLVKGLRGSSTSAVQTSVMRASPLETV